MTSLEPPDDLADPTTKRAYDGPAHAQASARSWGQRVVVIVACLSIASGLIIAGSIAVYLHRSSSTGRAAVQREQKAIAHVRASGACVHSASDPPVTTPDGQFIDAVLRVPKLGLVAPVLQGDDDPELDIGVGHVPDSSWPGFTGTDVLSAHDVTWFSHINQLAVGDSISMVTPCHTFSYTVIGHSVVNAGSPIFQTTHGRLVLVTCYPLNALFITPKRFLVEATLTAVTNQGTVSPPVSEASVLEAQGLDLAHNETPLGLLSLSGTPDRNWSQSSAPLQAEALALTLYFGALRSAIQAQATWWASLAPGVPLSDAAPLEGGRVVTTTPLQPTLVMAGTQLTGALVSTSLRISGGRAPGYYTLTMTGTVQNGQLVLTGWSMQRAASPAP
jgi:LPXTG-site transpeptidase (sortase) family protein